MSGLRTRPRTDVDPPRVELPSAGRISSRRAARAITCVVIKDLAAYSDYAAIILSGAAVAVDEGVASAGGLTLYLTAGIALLLAGLCIGVIVVCGVQMMRYRRTG